MTVVLLLMNEWTVEACKAEMPIIAKPTIHTYATLSWPVETADIREGKMEMPFLHLNASISTLKNIKWNLHTRIQRPTGKSLVDFILSVT